VAEAEAAGGSLRKKPHGPSPRKKFRGKETFLLCLDRAKATAERGRTEPIGLEDPQGNPQGEPDDRTETGGWSEGGRPEKVPPRTTKPPPVTQEDVGAGNLDSEEEEFDEDNDDDDGPERRSVVHERADGGRPKEGSLDAARDEATRASIPDRPCGTKRDGGEDDRTNDDDEELDAARDEARRRPLSARPRGATRDDGANDQAVSGRPRIPKTTGDLDDDDEDLDEDVVGRARAALAWVPPRGYAPSNVVRSDKPYDVAAWALSALRDNEPDGRNPRVVPNHGRESDPPSVDGGVWVDDDARGGQSQGQPPPLVSTAWFGWWEVVGSTVGNTQGKTGQRGSAADFFSGTAAGVPRGHQFEKEAEAHGVPTALFGSSEVFVSAVGKTQGKTGQRGSAANFFPGTTAGVPRGHHFEKEAEAHGVPTRKRREPMTCVYVFVASGSRG
jgi:hypothetical protein